MRRSALWLAVCLAAASPVTAAEPVNPPPVLETIGMWLAANYELPLAEPPALVTAPATELVTMRYGAGSTIPSPEVIAVYDEGDNTIYLTAGWTGGTPAELSVLVHEMVHHLQDASQMRFACPGEREALAYRAQDAWLQLFGTDLKSAFGIDSATLIIATVCTH